jgi:hypothetical protein
MTILWPLILFFQSVTEHLPSPTVGWIERAVYFAGILALLANQVFGVFGKRKSEIHATDTAHINSLQGLLATLREKVVEQDKTNAALQVNYEQAKKELTALALIEIGKLLNFASQKRELDAALEENKELRRKCAALELDCETQDVARKSGEYRRERK